MSLEFSTLPSGKYQIGVITFNNPEKRNVLNYKMVTDMVEQLQKWESDKSIAAILYQSSDEKCFSAGGDVKEIRDSILKSKTDSGAINRIRDFFFNEYLTNYLNYTYKKPTIIWAEGISMGAGLGLFRSGHIRIASTNCIFAMPEMAIGFFPDVGASWFLHQIPNGIGSYLGLTGIRFNTTDALDWKVATHAIDYKKKAEVLSDLANIRWGETLQERKEQVHRLMINYHDAPKATGLVTPFKETIHQIMQGKTLRDFSENLKVHAPLPHMEYIYNASPISVAVTFEMLKQSKNWSIHEAFMHEWVMATKFCRDSDFVEGVRALLVDKDRKPKLHFQDMLKVPDELISGYFNFQMLKYDNPWEDYFNKRGAALEV
ncbi:MAG: hypothetical protein A4S09_04685 [Proteobacteria bacterium SG_bin7]|nr:MAG: hypothetical protein A4S09_04685 [Proteobacteria bacterium SG_bin7]